MASVLIIDDDHQLCQMMSELVQKMGCHPVCAFSAQSGLNICEQSDFDIVFLDVNLPDVSGLDILSRIRETPSRPEVVIITGFGDPDGAEVAIKNGAWDYLQKPVSAKRLILLLKRVMQYRAERQPPGMDAQRIDIEGITGSSPSMKACIEVLSLAAASDANVLITGETGTGKDLFARTIHRHSARAKKNLVVVDCTAIPETLVESWMLGYEKGAFTGADLPREGLILQAHRGTLFLNEVGDLPFSAQKSFLRVLEERKFVPVGGTDEVHSEFRLLAATHRDLDRMVAEGSFRRDLLFRLRTINIHIPALRERSGDIPELTAWHLQRLQAGGAGSPKRLTDEFLDALQSYAWPGNIRELFHCLDQAMILSGEEPTLYAKHLPTYIRVAMAKASVQAESSAKSRTETLARETMLPRFREFREKALCGAEADYVNHLMALADRDIRKACEISGLGRTRLYALLKKHGSRRMP